MAQDTSFVMICKNDMTSPILSPPPTNEQSATATWTYLLN